MDNSSTVTTVTVDPRHVAYTHVMYALHALAVLIGIVSSVSIIDKFVFGLPSIIAVVMNYARRSEVRGTWLAPHFRWQLRTFWIAAILLICSWPLVLTIILIPLVIGLYFVVGIWVAYRIGRGWLALKEGRSMPNSNF